MGDNIETIFVPGLGAVLWAEGPAVRPAQGNALGSKGGNCFVGPTGPSFHGANRWPVGPIPSHNGSESPERCPELGEPLPRWGSNVAALEQKQSQTPSLNNIEFLAAHTECACYLPPPTLNPIASIMR
jgi:hypothetical protein